MNKVYRSPDIDWKYVYNVAIDQYHYEFGDRVPMAETIEDANAALTHAVETHDHIPVNILSALEGDFVSPIRFEGRILFADDLPDGSDLDPETKRYVDVFVTCTQRRQTTSYSVL